MVVCNSIQEVTMARAALGLVLFLILAAPAATPATAVTDPDLAKGIAQVDEGDYDGAILTLDNATRRLVADRAKGEQLSTAYLYLGIAYLGKGADAAAKAKFRLAIGQIRDLTLSPEKYPPKVINLFEQAKDEMARAASAPPAAAAPAKKGGSSKALLIGGVVVAGGAAAALAAGGGGGSSASSSSSSGGESGSLRTSTFSGFVGNTGDISSQNYQVIVTGSGTLAATVTWQEADAVVVLSLSTATATLADSGRTGQTEATLTLGVTPQTYTVSVRFSATSTGPIAHYTLTVRYP